MVNDVTVPVLASFKAVCTSSPVFMLTGGTPFGGTYMVEGVNTSSFDPVLFAPGTYNIEYDYTHNGCTAPATDSIVVKPAISVSGTGVNPLCSSGATGSITISATGGTTPFGFAWNNNSSSQNLINLSAGTYSVMVSDSFGCKGSKTFVLTAPGAIVPNQGSTKTSSCAASDGSAYVKPTGGTPGYTYLWSPGGSIKDSITSEPGGIYNVTITDTNHCSILVSVSIAETGAPADTLPAFTALCANSSAIVFNTGKPAGGIYKVDGVTATGFNPKTSGPGTYSVAYIITGGCTSTTVQTLTVNAAPVVSLGADMSVCKNGGTILFNYGYPSGGHYTLDGNSAVSLIPSDKSNGNHSLIYSYTDTSNCTSADTQVINVKGVTMPSLNAFADLCPSSAVLTLSGGSPAGGFYEIGGTEVTSFNPTLSAPGTYQVLYIYNSNGCSDTASQPLVLNTCSDLEISTVTGLEVYPNPTNGLLNLTVITQSGEAVIKVVNTQGQELLVDSEGGLGQILKVLNFWELFPGYLHGSCIYRWKGINEEGDFNKSEIGHTGDKHF